MQANYSPIVSSALEAYQAFISGNYDQAIYLYEQSIYLQPEQRANYGYLGLSLLLQERESEAQIAWFSAVEDPEEFDNWANELSQILDTEAERLIHQSEYATAWLIRQHLFEISPLNLYNLIESVRLTIEQPKLDLEGQGVTLLIDTLASYRLPILDREIVAFNRLIEKIFASISDKKVTNLENLNNLALNHGQRNAAIISALKVDLSESINLLKLYLQKADREQANTSINNFLDKLQNIPRQAALVYAQACLEIFPESLTLLIRIVNLLQNLELHFESVEFAQQIVDKSEDIGLKISAYYSVTRGLMNTGGKWQEAQLAYDQCIILIKELISKNQSLGTLNTLHLSSQGIYSYYLGDLPKSSHEFLGKLGTYYQYQIRKILGGLGSTTNKLGQLVKQSRKLKIGYISGCMRRHSIGWISRWLLMNHNPEKFEIYVYSLIKTEDNIQLSIIPSVNSFQFFKDDPATPIVCIKDIADQIQKDKIDILIDLDSLTSVPICAVIALKPAPVQVTWLGADASGIPAVDYFIADPYVLPESADTYYASKIWRLPQTYVAVNGFEIGTPTLRREDLQIPQDAVIYLSVQAPHKRHPDVLRHQMQILKQVPNSYFLLKSSGMSTNLEEHISEIALEEGISTDRLRFLPLTMTEELHRANYAIADVILDTYPYNGATTTLEALWMEIPIVTRVGEQFVARNSYTMMINAGINEGIAWTDQEYIDWGIRLGLDSNLRQQISWKLKRAKQYAPLWDVKQFTREMENAYEEMWAKYRESELQDLEIDQEQIRVIAEVEIKNAQGINLAQENNLEDAIKCFKDAIDLNPDYIDSHYNLGIAFNQIEDFEAAIACFQKAIDLNPDYANAYYNLGIALTSQDKYEDAEIYFQKSLEISPQDFETHLALANTLLEQKKYDQAIKVYRSALKINPKSAPVHCSIAVALSSQQKYTQAISSLQTAISIDPDLAQAHCNLACTLSKLGDRYAEAIQCFQKAIELDPTLGEAYLNLIDLLNDGKNPLGKSFPLQRQMADQFLANCKSKERLRALINAIDVYTRIGLGDCISSLVDELEETIFNNPKHLTKADIQHLYICYIFTLASLRDSRELNSKIFKLIGDLYVHRSLQPAATELSFDISQIEQINQQLPIESRNLRIGFLSSYFRRHSVGWCSLDVITELSKITPHIYLYSTVEIPADELTTSFKNLAEKCVWRLKNKDSADENGGDESISEEIKLSDLIQEIANDRLDVLVDLDSVTVPAHTSVLYQKPATICISWLGFDAPYISSDNYCLCDWSTHPEGSEHYYPEKLVRLPDSHMAVSGFKAISLVSRADFEISPEQVVYLYSAASRKFNTDTAKAHVQILSHVPDSVLMYKGGGDRDSIYSIYLNECESQNVDSRRIKFMPTTKTEENHRAFYSLADVFLDAYPYNGGTHNLEALWFNLPVVTRKGDQSFARMGYSFLRAVGINEGIANSWDEYVEWGIKLGRDNALRNSIKQKLIQSKQPETLAPLWNPKKMAMDMYSLFKQLLSLSSGVK